MPVSNDGSRPLVVVIDDNVDVREALKGLFRSAGLNAAVFDSIPAYKETVQPCRPDCMVLDVRFPGLSGLDFQEELVHAGVRLPIVFISGHADMELSARAIKAGAVAFLAKPVRDQDLLDAVQNAIAHDAQLRRDDWESIRRRADPALGRICDSYHSNKTASGRSQGT